MSTRPARPARPAAPNPLPPLAQRVPPPARRLDAVLRAGALERARAPLGDAETGMLAVAAGAVAAGKLAWDYANKPNALGRNIPQRNMESQLRGAGGGALIDALDACVLDGYKGHRMTPQQANAVLKELYDYNITGIDQYIDYAMSSGQTDNLLYLKLMCELHEHCPPMPDASPSPPQPPALRPQYSDYDTRPRLFGDASSPRPPQAPPLRPQRSAEKVGLF